MGAPQTCNGQCTHDHDKWGDNGYHPDHKAVGWHVMNAAYGGGSAADNNLLFEELAEAGGLQAWSRAELYFFAISRNQPMTHFVKLSDSALQQKVASLEEHRSQFRESPAAV